MVERNKDRWSSLSMKDKAELIKLYISNGISNIGAIRDSYNSFGDGGDTEPLYYDDTYIEPAVVKAFNSQEEYNRFLGEKGARVIREGTNRVAQKLFEGIKYTPIVGDVVDATDATVSLKEGDISKAAALVGMALLPNVLEKPIKAVGKGVKNLKIYNRYTKDANRFNTAVNYAVDKYSKRADLLNANLGGTSKKRVINAGDDLLYSTKGSAISTNFRLRALHPKRGGTYYRNTDEIWLNRFNPYILKAAWESPKTAIKTLQGIAVHEGTHRALNNLATDLTNRISVKGKKYFTANKNHPLYDRVGYAFADPNRDASYWERSPEEFIADMNKAAFNMGIDPTLNVKNWNTKNKETLVNRLAKRYGFTPEDTLFIAEELSDFGYKNGGKLNKFTTGGDLEKTYPMGAVAGSGDKYVDIVTSRENDVYNALLRNGYSIEDARRLSPILTAQSIYETGWKLRDSNNNYAGYLGSNGKLKYDSADEFWDSHLINLTKRWPNWDKAKSVEDYYNIVNQTHLGLQSKEEYDKYKKSHPNTFIYSPEWENKNYRSNLINTGKRVNAYLDRTSANKDFPLNMDKDIFYDQNFFNISLF